MVRFSYDIQKCTGKYVHKVLHFVKYERKVSEYETD